jgi:membrane-associated phospholipid phosphatase
VTLTEPYCNRTCLLPVAYAEGCPTHPSYPAAHAATAGACATVLKAFFNRLLAKVLGRMAQVGKRGE